MCTKGRDVINADSFRGRQGCTLESVPPSTGSRRRLLVLLSTP